MESKKTLINERDIERHMNDQASRIEITGIALKKYAHLQKLMYKIYALSDKEFEIAFSTLESLVDNFATKQTKSENDKDSKKSKNKKEATDLVTK